MQCKTGLYALTEAITLDELITETTARMPAMRVILVGEAGWIVN